MKQTVLMIVRGVTFLLLMFWLATQGYAASYDLNEGDADVGTVSTQVLAAKGNRLVLVLQNNSDTTVWCMSNSTTAVVGSGTQIFPGATTYDDVVVPTGAVNCIHNGTGTKRVHWKQTK